MKIGGPNMPPSYDPGYQRRFGGSFRKRLADLRYTRERPSDKAKLRIQALDIDTKIKRLKDARTKIRRDCPQWRYASDLVERIIDIEIDIEELQELKQSILRDT